MTNAIGVRVAKTFISKRPIASDAPQAPSQATLGFVPLAFLWLLKARGFVMHVFGSSVVKFLPGPHFNHKNKKAIAGRKRKWLPFCFLRKQSTKNCLVLGSS